MRPQYSIYRGEELDWEALKDRTLSCWDGLEWVPVHHNTYAFLDGRWQSLTHNHYPGTMWGETFLDGVGSTPSLDMMGGSGGTAPSSLVVGGMTLGTGEGVPRFLQLNSGSGRLVWKTPGSGRIFGRVYLHPRTGPLGYNRNLIRFLDSSGTEVGALALYISSQGSTAENRLILFNRGSVADNNDGWYATDEGDIAPDQWTRVEFMLDPSRIIQLRVFSDMQSTVPSKSYFFDIGGHDFSGIRSIEVGESARTFPGNRQPTRIAHIAFSDSQWPGPADLDHIRLIGHYGNTITSDSTSCPLGNRTFQAGSYGVVAVAFSDVHTGPQIPQITPPQGFQLLGFEAVMNTSGDVRTFLFVFGRHFTSYDDSPKAFIVSGGRRGRWMTDERHYVNVNPDNPIAAAWEGETNALRGSGTVRVHPADIPSPLRGDVALSYVLTKVDNNNSDLTAGRVGPVNSEPAVPDGPGFFSYREVAPGRKSMMASCDQRLHRVDSHPVVGTRVNRVSSMTSAYGRLSLRAANQPANGEFAPYALPDGLTDLYTPPPPEPEPEYETFITTWNATWQASWYNFGKRDGTNLYQGRFDSSTGYQCSQIGFNDSDMRSKLSGATINKVEIYLKNSHFYSNAGGDAVVGTHDNSSEPGSPSTGEKWNRTRVGFAYGQGKWFTVSTSFGNDFKSGAARGLTLGRPNGGSLSEYGYFVGDGSSRPKIRITYTKRVN